MMCRMLGRLRRCAIAGAVASRASGELGTLLVFSLAGLDLSGWLFVEGWLRPSGALVKTFLLLG